MKRQKDDMQVNVAGFRRNIKNLAHNYSDAQIKVREATSNDPWGPSATIMAEIADLTYNVVAFSEIMQMIWKRLNDHGKNWRHVYKALILLEYLIKTGSEKVAQQCKENIFAIHTLKEFQYYDEGTDQGMRVRDKAKQLVSLLKDDERLKNERTKALKAKERFAQNASGFGSDGSIDGPTQRESPSWRTDSTESNRNVSEIEYVRPQTVGEEELQLQLAMAMSREEAQQEEAKRRSDDVRLQLALSQSEQDFKIDDDHPEKPEQSHLMDLLNISLAGTSISSPPASSDPWGLPAPSKPETTDPWSRTSTPSNDPWHGNVASNVPSKYSAASNIEGWLSRTQSPSVTSGSSTEGWLHNNGATPQKLSTTNGNIPTHGTIDPWLSKIEQHQQQQQQSPLATTNTTTTTDPWLNKPSTVTDPWQTNINSNKNNDFQSEQIDPWAPAAHIGARPSPIGAHTSPNAGDLDEFDLISNRSKSVPLNGSNNNNSSLLDEMDPLSMKKPTKSPQSFLGENSSLVNLDNLIKPAVPNNVDQTSSLGYNPFGILPPNQQSQQQQQQQPQQQRTNLFQQQAQPVPSINQLKQNQFPVTLSQDPWAPVPSNNLSQNNNNNNNSSSSSSSNKNSISNNNQIPAWYKPESASSNPFLS